MSTRIYLVTTKGGKQKLVEATTASTAIKHVAKGLIGAKVATAKETAQLMKAGIELESAVEGESDDTAAAPATV